MTDFTEKLSANDEPDFEGHKLVGPQKLTGTEDTKLTANDEPDFEGHKLTGPEKFADPKKLV
jgi:hypothetical protein